MPFTRAGCDVGGVGTANIELENTATNATGDMTRVFGANSPEWNEAGRETPTLMSGKKDRFRRDRDPLRQRLHEQVLGRRSAKPDPLPDEPGGYSGFNALFGAKYVDPAIAGGQSVRQRHERRLPIKDPAG